MFVGLGTMWGYYSDSTFSQTLALITNFPTIIVNEIFRTIGITVSADLDTVVFGTTHFILWGLVWWCLVLLYRVSKSALNKESVDDAKDAQHN